MEVAFWSSVVISGFERVDHHRHHRPAEWVLWVRPITRTDSKIVRWLIDVLQQE